MALDPRRLRGNWNFPTAIWFGAGKINLLARACRAAGTARPLVVTDPGLATLPMIAQSLDSLTKNGLRPALFSAIRANPVGANVADGVAALKAHRADGVVTFGGGSAMDAGKAIALAAAQVEGGPTLFDFQEGRDTPPGTVTPLPTVAVPTTAGTGSEVGRAAVIREEATGRKIIVFHPGLMAKVVISDPALTVGLSPHLTAATGMDALAHCLEAYCSPFHNPLCDGIALEGMRLVRDHLPDAVRDGTDLVARSQMLAAAHMGATAFQKGLGAIHAMSHPIGARFDTHHGLTNAVVMPYVLAFNRAAIDEKMARLARYIDLPGRGTSAVIDWALALREAFDEPHTLAALGVTQDSLSYLATEAAIDPCSGGNPMPLDVPALTELFADAWAGRIR
ncbi:MAG: iron-containing alcohol dehydrogenase [Alphaproteobacteria bacterium]|nr:iron-containing alcohol dehydrogenase [Alphaproteobacteria bacterium]